MKGSEKALDVLRDIVARPVLVADKFPHDPSIFDDVRFWNLERAVLGADVPTWIASGVEGDVNSIEEIAILLLIFVYAHAQHHYTGLRKPFLKLIEGRDLLHASGAPGRPKIQNQNLAAEVSRRYFLPLIGLNREFGRRIAFFGRGISETKADEPQENQC